MKWIHANMILISCAYYFPSQERMAKNTGTLSLHYLAAKPMEIYHFKDYFLIFSLTSFMYDICSESSRNEGSKQKCICHVM
jgi:hypothetical protein